jgi:hypothetical protein
MPDKNNKSHKRGNQYLRPALGAALIMAIIAIAIVVAGTGRVPNTRTSPNAIMLPPPQAPSVTLAKEYIYAGGRLVATEEEGLLPPSDLSALLWCHAHLSWRDNSQNETGFKLEILNADGITWSVDRVLPANTGHQSSVEKKFEPATFRVRAFNANGDSAPSNSVTVPALIGMPCPAGQPPTCTPSAGLIVSEFRLRGALTSNDEYIELTNNTDQPLTVCSPDASSGWAVASSDGIIRFVIPNGTVIPARGHYLAAGKEYSLGSETTTSADVTYPTETPDNSGLALFNTAYPQNFTLAARFDAVGFTTSPDLYREGTGLPVMGANGGNYALLRKLNFGYPLDTGNNSADFIFVATNAGLYGSLQAILGAPGPENLRSPIQRNAQLPVTVIDPAVAASVAPNRVRDTTAVGPNAALGTLTLRRKITNNTGSNVTKLRFRVVDITTLNSPGYVPGGSQADVRVLSSNDVNVTITGGQMVLVRGTTIESPPNQPNGGGLNSTLNTTVISLSQPLLPGQSVNVQLALGVQQSGSFRILFNLEALP